MAELGKRRHDGTHSSKKGIGSPYPLNVIEAAPGLDRVEAFLTPIKLKKRFLFGVPLTSPITQESIDNADLKDYITRAASLIETELKVSIFPVIQRFRLPFDPNMYRQFIYLELPVRPIQQVLQLAITSASYTQTGEDNENSKYPRGLEIYILPNEWVDLSNALRGKLNVNPLNPAFSAIGSNVSVPASGAGILQMLGQIRFVPAYWNCEVLAGFGSTEGQVPVVINELVGSTAAILILDQVIPQFRIVSQSLSIDGLGQSVSNQAYLLMQDKRDQLQIRRKEIMEKIKSMVSVKLFSTHF